MEGLNLSFILLFSVLAFLSILILVCFILCMVCFSKIGKIKKATKNALTEETVLQYIDKVRERASGTIPEGSDLSAFSKSAVVKFNAYEDVTGEYSFSLALLNGFNSGVILTSLYGHNSCNTYIRNVRYGRCETYLLDEEKQALENALVGKE